MPSVAGMEEICSLYDTFGRKSLSLCEGAQIRALIPVTPVSSLLTALISVEKSISAFSTFKFATGTIDNKGTCNTRPVAVSGDLGSDEQKSVLLETKKLKAKISRLKQLHQKISDMIVEQERLHQISKDAFEEDTYEFDKDKYLMAQSNVVNRIMEYQEQIMNMEIKYGLDKDYE